MANKRDICVWSIIHSPHMIGMLEELVVLGYRVTYIAFSELPESRASIGWKGISSKGVRLLDINKEILANHGDCISEFGVNILCGLRGCNSHRRLVNIFKQRGLKFWLMLESPDFNGSLGWLRQLYYDYLFFLNRKIIIGVLSIGESFTRSIKHKVSQSIPVFEFAYFVPEVCNLEVSLPKLKKIQQEGVTNFLFVGELINRKRVDLILHAISSMPNARLTIIGDGIQASELYDLGNCMAPGRINWMGSIPMGRVREIMRKHDCLLIPSRHDGWGVVVTESLLTGTPVIVSNRCGSAGIIKPSFNGYVFDYSKPSDLFQKMKMFVDHSVEFEKRRKIIENQAQLLSAINGANYLNDIIERGLVDEVTPPWRSKALNEN